jgi:hypothetical protein
MDGIAFDIQVDQGLKSELVMIAKREMTSTHDVLR